MSIPTSPRAMPWLMPLMTNGSVNGKITLTYSCTSFVPKIRPARTSDGSTVFTPSMQLTIIGKTADSTMIVSCMELPKPRTRISRGMSATRGNAVIAHT